jgi:tetratricopeptide (TPR) repeat protein
VADPQRLEELRRRVQKDPASLAFAQLAEECRRAGQLHEAVRVCRAGLAHRPDYLSARVTLGRALLALEHLDQAGAELAGVLRIAPENLAALRGLAEVHHRRGLVAEALEYYRRALALAPHDHEIHAAMEALRHQPPPLPTTDPAATHVADVPHTDLSADAPVEPTAAASPDAPVEPTAAVPANAPVEPTAVASAETLPAPDPARPSEPDVPVIEPGPGLAMDGAARAAAIQRLERWLAAVERRAEDARAAR